MGGDGERVIDLDAIGRYMYTLETWATLIHSF